MKDIWAKKAENIMLSVIGGCMVAVFTIGVKDEKDALIFAILLALVSALGVFLINRNQKVET